MKAWWRKEREGLGRRKGERRETSCCLLLIQLNSSEIDLPEPAPLFFLNFFQTEEELLWFQRDIESEVEERGQDETMVRLLDRLDGRGKAEIEAIDRALFKLGTERYGQCEQCGTGIPQSRLEAVPAAAFCLTCEQAEESQATLRK